MKRNHKPIPDEIREQIKVLAIEGLSVRSISKRLEISVNAVHRIKKEIDDLEQFRTDKKRKIAEKYWEKVIMALNLITEGRLQSLSATQLMTTAAIGTDKAQLLTGEATDILQVKSDDELDREWKKLDQAEKELQAAWLRAEAKRKAKEKTKGGQS